MEQQQQPGQKPVTMPVTAEEEDEPMEAEATMPTPGAVSVDPEHWPNDDEPEFLTVGEDAVEIQVDEENIPMDEEDDDDDDDDDHDDENKMQDDDDDDQQDQSSSSAACLTISTHTAPVYAIAAFIVQESSSSPQQQEQDQPRSENKHNNGVISVVSGGGDDKAFWHRVIPTTATAATNNASDPTKTMATIRTIPSNHSSTQKTTNSILAGDDTDFIQPTQQENVVSLESKPLSYAHTDSVSAVAWNLPFVVEDETNNNSNNTSDTAKKKKSHRYLAVGGYDGAIVIYDADDPGSSNNPLQTLEGPTDVECLAFHPKGGTVLLAGSAADGTLWMYHVPMQKCLQVFVGHESALTACAFSNDGKWALSASSDGTVRQWAPRTGNCKHVFRCSSSSGGGDGGGDHDDVSPVAGLTCMAVGGGTDGQLLLVGAEDGKAFICHVGTQKIVATLSHAEPEAAENIVNNNDNDDDDGTVLEAMTSVEAVGFSPSHPNWCATGGVDGVLKIWDLTTPGGSCRQVCCVRNDDDNDDNKNNNIPTTTNGGITRLQWHPTWPLCFTSTTEGTVNVWDARNGQLVHSVTSGHQRRQRRNQEQQQQLNALDIQFTHNHQQAWMVTGSDDHAVRLFHINVQALWNQQNNNASALTNTTAAMSNTSSTVVVPKLS